MLERTERFQGGFHYGWEEEIMEEIMEEADGGRARSSCTLDRSTDGNAVCRSRMGRRLGADAVLIGETLMRSDDIAGTLHQLREGV